MNKITTFLQAFKNSIVKPSYSNDIVRAPFSFSFKYFLMCALLFSLASTAIFTLKVQPKIESFVKQTPDAILNTFPDDLVIYTQGGDWYINKKEPYAIPMPDFITGPFALMETSASINGMPQNQNPLLQKNLIVFYKQGTIEDVSRFQTFMLVNQKNILMRSDNGRIEVSPLGELANARVTKQTIEQMVEQLKPFLDKVLLITVPLALTVIFVGNFLGQLIYLLWLAFLVWVVAKLMGKGVSYKKSYQLGIHAITLPWLLKVLLSLFVFGLPLPFWFTALALVVAIVGLSKVTDETTVETAEPIVP